jgi:hypothetical protein
MLTDYPNDPLGLMPRGLPQRPRVLLNAADLERCRRFAREYPWARYAMEQVVAKATATQLDNDFGDAPPQFATRGTEFLNLAIAAAFEERADWAGQVIGYLQRLAENYRRWPVHEEGSRLVTNLHVDKMLATNMAMAYDLCVDLNNTDGEIRQRIEHELFRPSVEEVAWQPIHLMCSNHHTTALVTSLAVGSAIDEPRYIHDAFYGHTYEDGRRSAGMAHQLMHDFLNDGLHWERTFGYHLYTLYCVTRFAWIAARLGTDLWDRAWPATTELAGDDENHHDFDATGDKYLRDYFIAPLYLAHSDYSVARFGDSSREKIYQIASWGPIYEQAWTHTGDERIAWLLNRCYEILREDHKVDFTPRGYGDPQFIDLFHFIHVEREELPQGRFDLSEDATFCLTGKHENGCTLFPSTGLAVLRADANDPQASNLTVNFAPHAAGHQHADLLSFVWQIDGKTALVDPPHYDFEGPLHGAWFSQTVCHNTVLVDGISHRPQGDTDYWYCTDPTAELARGRVIAYGTDGADKFITVETTNAYDESISLTRHLLLTPDYIFDAFHCRAASSHRWDYVLHPCAAPAIELNFAAQDGPPLDTHGIRMLKNVRSAALPAAGVRLEWDGYAAWLCPESDGKITVATNPAQDSTAATTVLITQHGTTAKFYAVFSRRGEKISLQKTADSIAIVHGDKMHRVDTRKHTAIP